MGNGNRNGKQEWEFANKAAWAEITQSSWLSSSQIEPETAKRSDSL